MAVIITPNSTVQSSPHLPHLFLAGSIEQGKATNWQQKAAEFYSAQQELKDPVIVNPRRDDWDATMTQDANNREFFYQVTFELGYIEKSDAVIMWLEPGTMSPISLFEFGLMTGWRHAGWADKLIVGCPDGFWRKGNVEVVTARYGIQVVDSFDQLLVGGYRLLKHNYARRMGNIS